jgi:hypothetical protein
VADVVKLVREGRAQFWSFGDGAITTELHDFPRMRAVHFWTISGAMADCLALENDILPWAMEQGCTMATATGRRGWGRVAGPTGWRSQPHMFNFYKPLSSC